MKAEFEVVDFRDSGIGHAAPMIRAAALGGAGRGAPGCFGRECSGSRSSGGTGGKGGGAKARARSPPTGGLDIAAQPAGHDSLAMKSLLYQRSALIKESGHNQIKARDLQAPSEWVL